jgi:hypothetical protein
VSCADAGDVVLARPRQTTWLASNQASSQRIIDVRHISISTRLSHAHASYLSSIPAVLYFIKEYEQHQINAFATCVPFQLVRSAASR